MTPRWTHAGGEAANRFQTTTSNKKKKKRKEKKCIP